MKILVTGGAGFIGSHVVDALMAKGHVPVVFDNLSHGKRSNLPKDVRLIYGDITDRDAVTGVVAEGFDGIMHLAAQKSVVNSMSDPSFDAQVNIMGTLNLLMAAVEAGVGRFVFAGTGGALYGDTDVRPTPESHPAEPESPYGISKLSGERYIRHFADRFGMTAGILRLANVYGPRQDHTGEGGVVSIFCHRAKEGRGIEVYGDGEQTRDYVYAGDVADALMRCLDLRETATMNIGTGMETSVNDLIAGVEAASGGKLECYALAARAGEIRHSCLAIDQASARIGWVPTTSLAAGLALTLASI